ncbi:MAG: hypothetical protein QOJ51_3647 [Acidobacteriaceae bacterium]|jgi:hypothetical protein|nr:hypothetical protein [Acidobacteriaceae bacterium]
MMAVSTEQEIRTFEIVKEETIAASVEIVFETLLEQLGPFNETPDGDTHSGDQAAGAAGNLRTALHVVSSHVEFAVPAKGRERRDAFEVCSSGDGADPTRTRRRVAKCGHRLESYDGKSS